MKKPIIEKWTNNTGGREDHYFADAGKKIYLFGCNPDLVPQKYARMLLKAILNTNKLKGLQHDITRFNPKN